MHDLHQLLVELARDPESPDVNLRLAAIYHGLGHTAAAITFYTRTAERTSMTDLAYACLLRTARCLDDQGNRHISVRAMLKRAMVLDPHRPEAYWYLAKFNAYHNQHSDCVTFCDIAQALCDFERPPLPIDVGYPGHWALKLNRCVSAWWWGMNDQVRQDLQMLYDQHWSDMDQVHRSILLDNMKRANMLGDFWQREYQRACDTASDINQHLPKLLELAKECQHVTEMGVRWGTSTRAWLHSGVILRSYDIELDAGVQKLFDLAQYLDRDAALIQANVLEISIDQTDLLFIDTLHQYQQLRQELARHADRSRKYLVFHDTTTFAHRDEMGSGPGLWPAIEEFLAANPHWQLCYRSHDNNGLTVLRRS